MALILEGSQPLLPSGGTVASTDISDSTSAGRTLLTAASLDAARTSLDAPSTATLDALISGLAGVSLSLYTPGVLTVLEAPDMATTGGDYIGPWTYLAGVLTAGVNGDMEMPISTRIGVRFLDAPGSIRNGVYVVTDGGSVSTPLVLARATDFDTSEDFVDGSAFVVEDGGDVLLYRLGVADPFLLDADGVKLDPIGPESIASLGLIDLLGEGAPAGRAVVADGADQLTTTSADVSALLAAANAAAALVAIGAVPTSTLTTRGDLLRRGASAAERFALGAAGTRLRSDGTDPVWADPDVVCTTAELSTTYAPSAVLRGVVARTSDGLATYVCCSGTVSGYVWVLLVPGQRPIGTSTYVWRCNDAPGATSIAEASGGPALTLTGSTWALGDVGFGRWDGCAYLQPGAAGADRATAAITATSGDLTIECEFVLPFLHGITFGTSQTGLFSMANGLGQYVYTRLSWSSGATGFMAGWKPDGGAEQSTSVGVLAGSTIPTGVPHHAMLAITKGSGSSNGTMQLYLDGVLVDTATSIRDASLLAAGGTWTAHLCNASNNVAPTCRFREFRITNGTAQTAAYARAATSQMRARA